jgi:SAM-dependent methyltransferase
VTQRLNLGCGLDYRDGWTNADVRESVEPDVVVDLDDYPWPFEMDRFDVVLADNVLEHLDDQLRALEELQRVTAPSGEIVVRGPHWNSPGQAIDPTHSTPVDPRTFEHDVAPSWRVDSVSYSRVRFGRVLPERLAAVLADHVGHVVDGWEVRLRLEDVERGEQA